MTHVTEMKCFNEVAEVIGEEFAIRELVKVKENCQKKRLNFSYNQSLLSAFKWQSTPQGKEFWSNIFAKETPKIRVEKWLVLKRLLGFLVKKLQR